MSEWRDSKDGECVPISEAFKNLAECLKFVMENPEGRITQEDCLSIFQNTGSVDINSNKGENRIE